MIKKAVVFLVITLVLFSGAYFLMNFLKSNTELASTIDFLYIYIYFLTVNLQFTEEIVINSDIKSVTKNVIG